MSLPRSGGCHTYQTHPQLFEGTLPCEARFHVNWFPFYEQWVLRQVITRAGTKSQQPNQSRIKIPHRGRSILLRLTCTSTRTLFLLLDDVQWADINSLEVMTAILEDRNESFVVCVLVPRRRKRSQTFLFGQLGGIVRKKKQNHRHAHEVELLLSLR